jgi:hypothetical protein
MKCIWCLKTDHTVDGCVEFAMIEPRGKVSDVGVRINMLRMMNGQLVRLLSANGIMIPQSIIDMNPDRVSV